MSDLIEEARRRYAEELRFTARLGSRAVIDAFATVPRERFLGPGPWRLLSPMALGEYWTTEDADPRHIYHDVLIAIDEERRGLARQMLVHRVPHYAVATTRAQQVSGRNGLGSPASIKRHACAIRIIFDRRHFGAKFHCKAEVVQMLAQKSFGAPLRLAALKIISTTGVSKILAPNFLQTGTEEFKAPDVHAGAKKRLSQASSIEHLHYRWLEKGATRLVMRREPSLEDARLDAMA